MNDAAIVDFGQPSRLWGDGFAQDGLRALLTVRSWDQIETDELLRYCPRLRPVGERVPDRLVHHLQACVAARSFRLRHVHGVNHAPALRSISPGEVEHSGEACHALMFGRPGWMDGVLDRAWRSSSPREMVDQDASALLLLDELAERASTGTLGQAMPVPTPLFAYLTGIHPAYVWPAALVTQERDLAAGWLGVIARGRPALMPAEVAEYLLDAITVQAGRAAIRDAELTRLPDLGISPEIVRYAALRRQRGRTVVLRRPYRATARMIQLLRSLGSTPAPAEADAFGRF